MGYREYTHCVQPGDYNDPSPQGSWGAKFWSILTSGGVDQARAIICEYLLGGKLICLGGDQCAIGHITKFEPPSDKSFPDSIDNDFSMNLLLSPHGLGQFAWGKKIDNYWLVAKDGHQGGLITEQPGMPSPHDAISDWTPNKQPSPVFQGYYTEYLSSSYISYDPKASPFQVPGSDQGFEVPVLHVECEGSRIADVCAAIDATWGPIHSAVCDIPLIGGFVCTILSIALLPFILAVIVPAVTAAWLAARDGNADDARQDPGAGELRLGDRIIVTGRWAYDAGHQGWNELHPVKTIQKIPSDSKWADGDFDGWRTRWCDAVMAVPPFAGLGIRPVGMTPGQAQTYDNQIAPGNQWWVHPLLDGCTTPPAPLR